MVFPKGKTKTDPGYPYLHLPFLHHVKSIVAFTLCCLLYLPFLRESPKGTSEVPFASLSEACSRALLGPFIYIYIYIYIHVPLALSGARPVAFQLVRAGLWSAVLKSSLSARDKMQPGDVDKQKQGSLIHRISFDKQNKSFLGGSSATLTGVKRRQGRRGRRPPFKVGRRPWQPSP